MEKLSYFFCYFAIISLFSIIITLFDKHQARKNKFRIPELVLFFIAAIGGAFAMLLTMKIIHHKTSHKRFMLGLPLFIIIQVFLFIFMFVSLL